MIFLQCSAAIKLLIPSQGWLAFLCRTFFLHTCWRCMSVYIVGSIIWLKKEYFRWGRPPAMSFSLVHKVLHQQVFVGNLQFVNFCNLASCNVMVVYIGILKLKSHKQPELPGKAISYFQFPFLSVPVSFPKIC